MILMNLPIIMATTYLHSSSACSHFHNTSLSIVSFGSVSASCCFVDFIFGTLDMVFCNNDDVMSIIIIVSMRKL